jgi:hypothetical protein|tara:strand:+ start:430 stop:717 length:288 start_codon:yes stop_codon:yes gene_type:complete
MGLDKFEKNLMERIEQEKEADRERMLRELKPNRDKNQMKKREIKAANKSELNDFASRRSCSQTTQQLNESKQEKFDLDESVVSTIRKDEKHLNKN